MNLSKPSRDPRVGQGWRILGKRVGTMTISPETYIVISLMFAVFAAVAAVGTSVVLGAGFERLRAGFDLVKRQSGFFADAIYKLDQRTQKLDEEQSKLKSGLYNVGERMDRVEKQVTFMGDAVSSLEQRILQGSPTQAAAKQAIRMHPVHTVSPSRPKVQTGFVGRAPVREQANAQPQPIMSGLFRDFPEEAPVHSDLRNDVQNYSEGGALEDPDTSSGGLTTLLARYFTGEQSGGKGVVYH